MLYASCQFGRPWRLSAAVMSSGSSVRLSPEYLMRDNDAKFSGQFDEVFRTSRVQIKRTVPMSPNLRAHVERFIQTLKFECLNKFVIVAEKHLDHICRIWSRYYNEE